MITIYGIRSPNVARLRAALIQKNLPFEHVNVDIRNKSEQFKELTPAETIPVLQDAGIVISDSIAAIHYLDDAYPNTYKMLGENPGEKGKILSIIWAIDRIGAMLSPLYLEPVAPLLREHNMAHRAVIYDEKQKENLRSDVGYRLERLWGWKGNQPFFTSKYSAADAAMLAMVANLERLGFAVGAWSVWKEEMLKDQVVAKMFPPDDEQGVRSI